MEKETSFIIIYFNSLIDVKGSSTCILWVYTSKWFCYVNDVKEEAVTHDHGTLTPAYSLQSLYLFTFIKVQMK